MIQVGDIVQCAITGTVLRVAEVHESKTSPPYLCIMSDGHTYAPTEFSPLYVPDMFRLAGFQVPQGAKLYTTSDDGGHTWYYGFPRGHEESGSERKMFTTHWQNCGLVGCWWQAMDLSRLFAADAWHCLPEVVRSIVVDSEDGK